MIKYFDKDFFKFLLGFVSILCTSLIILLASRLYQEEARVSKESNVSAVIKAVNN